MKFTTGISGTHVLLLQFRFLKQFLVEQTHMQLDNARSKEKRISLEQTFWPLTSQTLVRPGLTAFMTPKSLSTAFFFLPLAGLEPLRFFSLLGY